jgi:hypothetical protein
MSQALNEVSIRKEARFSEPRHSVSGRSMQGVFADSIVLNNGRHLSSYQERVTAMMKALFIRVWP